MSPRSLRIAGIAVGALAAAGLAAALALHVRELRAELATAYDRHHDRYAGSATCRGCHADRHESWYQTWHRTMTQEASARSVQGAFDGRVVEYWGVPVRPVTRDGNYFFEYLSADRSQVIGTARVTHTVGSHRYQQYLTHQPDDGTRYRLQLLWHIGDQRWVHMNGAFLRDDHQGFSDRVTIWNQNCIFCHNTGPVPNITNQDELVGRLTRGQRVNFATDMRFDSTVAELGIACEACHGPGADHAERNRNPLRRYLLHASDLRDPTIVHPAKLPAQRSAEVCGQCHAQRIPARTELGEDWLRSGPSYRPGDVLADHVRIITADLPGPPDSPEMFQRRFWADGTARLSAYEFTGITQSACYRGEQLTCQNCHDAHGGDPNGMMRDDGRSNAPCLACHQPLAENPTAHTRHAADSPGSLCVNCHMPPMVYGVMAVHRSHRIEVPDPAADARNARPGACAGCHLDRSADWAAAQVADWDRTVAADIAAPADARVPEHLRQLLGGDPVQRAIAAHLAGREDSALSGSRRLELIPALLLAMDDGYPAVRRFASRSVAAIAASAGATGVVRALGDFDFIGTPAARAAALAQVGTQWRGWQQQQGLRIAGVDPALASALRAEAARRSVDINIGE